MVYLNKGRESGVIRARLTTLLDLWGDQTSVHEEKFGYLVREIGLLRVLEVHDKARLPRSPSRATS